MESANLELILQANCGPVVLSECIRIQSLVRERCYFTYI
jgi:hypothetical protein